MKFAARHNYTDILDAAAPHAIGTDLKTMKEILPASLILPWVTYNDAYNQIAQGLPRMLTREVYEDEEGPNGHYDGYHDTYDTCKLGEKRTEIWRSIQRDIALVVVDGGAQNLRDLDRLFSLDLFQRVAACDWCHSTLSGYKFNVAQQMKELRSQHPLSSYVSNPRVDALRRRNEALAKEKEAVEVDKEALRIELQRALDARARAEAEAAKAKDVAVQAGRHVAEAHARAANAIRELIMAKDEVRRLGGEVRLLRDEGEATQKKLLQSQRRTRQLFKRLEQARAILYAEDDDDESASDGGGLVDVEMLDYKVEQKPDAPTTLTPPPETQPLPDAVAHVEAHTEETEAAVPQPGNASFSLPVTENEAEDSPRPPIAPEPYAPTPAPFRIQTTRAIALPTLIGVHPPQQANSDDTMVPTEDASNDKKRKWTTTIMKTWVGTNPSTTKPDLEVRDPRARARLERK
ncbi:hypothetical protein K523DRAFT_345053 [Schizophyllum commune Tattone D]|nr:hypothetical protein K523DRAFT_345053 [Schizophyllum commune Tattone D]